MGNIFILGGGMMMVFVNTKKGFEWRWVMVIVYLVLFAGVITYQVKTLNQKQFSKEMILQLH